MKKTAVLVLALLAVFLWVVPSFAAKQALNEDDLDRITAAGEPSFIQITNSADSTATVVLTFDNADVTSLDVATASQTTLRALTVNNIVGENQIANALNVKANGSGNQSNTVLQSWGSIDVTGVTTVVTATSGNATISATISGNQTANIGSTTSATNIVKCVGLNPCTKTQTQTINITGNTLNASSVAVALAIPRFIAADQIIIIDNNSDARDATVNLDYENISTAVLTVEGGSQTSLAALVVNNISGKNQVGNATNIQSSGDIGIGSGSTNNLVLVGSQNVAGSPGNQINSVSQYRGTPANALAVPLGIGIGASGAAIHGVGLTGTNVTVF